MAEDMIHLVGEIDVNPAESMLDAWNRLRKVGDQTGFCVTLDEFTSRGGRQLVVSAIPHHPYAYRITYTEGGWSVQHIDRHAYDGRTDRLGASGVRVWSRATVLLEGAVKAAKEVLRNAMDGTPPDPALVGKMVGDLEAAVSYARS